jgi:peroxiredoxin family protein
MTPILTLLFSISRIVDNLTTACAFSRSESSDGSNVMVFIASGLQQFAKPAAQQSRLAKRDGIRVMTIGYGDGAVLADLEDIASRNSMVCIPK